MLETIIGYKIPFHTIPKQTHVPPSSNFSDLENFQIMECISKLLSIKAISIVHNCENQFISSIFIVPKSDGTGRFILNLKHLNEFVNSPKFKMEDHRVAQRLINTGDYLAKIDLKDAYYLLPVATDHRKYLRFKHKEVLYQFNCLPFGLSSAPRIFTKLLRPVAAKLRSQGYRSVIYLDDFLLIGDTSHECQVNITETKALLTRLGWKINEAKSSREPCPVIEFLGYIFNTVDRTISLPRRKVDIITRMIQSLYSLDNVKTIDLAKLIGNLIAATPAVSYSLLYTRELECIKQKAVAISDYDGSCTLSTQAKSDLDWWLNSLSSPRNFMISDSFDYEMSTDSSLTGWGCCFNGVSANGSWTVQESQHHINTLEIMAILYSLMTFFRSKKDITILLRVDSTTAIAYINKYGGCRSSINHTKAREIWEWCQNRNLRLRATYIHTSCNVEADKASRSLANETDFSLDLNSFDRIKRRLGNPTIDLFASYLTKKCSRYASWFPDPNCCLVDAFSFTWNEFFYAFPPFSLIARVMRKIVDDGGYGIIIVPFWPSQAWYPLLQKLTLKSIILGKGTFKLSDPFSCRKHPLQDSLSLVAALVSGKKAA